MATDPEPDGLVPRSLDTHRTVLSVDTDRNETIRSMNVLKAEARVTGVVHELTICTTRLTPNIVRQRSQQLLKAGGSVRIHNRSGSSGVVRPCSCSFRASSAIRSRTPLDFRKISSHRRSDSISASNHAPISSCSLSGSFDASEIAFSSRSSHCTLFYQPRCPAQALRRGTVRMSGEMGISRQVSGGCANGSGVQPRRALTSSFESHFLRDCGLSPDRCPANKPATVRSSSTSGQ